MDVVFDLTLPFAHVHVDGWNVLPTVLPRASTLVRRFYVCWMFYATPEHARLFASSVHFHYLCHRSRNCSFLFLLLLRPGMPFAFWNVNL